MLGKFLCLDDKFLIKYNHVYKLLDIIIMKNNPKPSNISAEYLRDLRARRRESQTKFWKRFGVTQSRGSRFELGKQIPSPVTILIKLYLEGVIQDCDLQRAKRKIVV